MDKNLPTKYAGELAVLYNGNLAEYTRSIYNYITINKSPSEHVVWLHHDRFDHSEIIIVEVLGLYKTQLHRVAGADVGIVGAELYNLANKLRKAGFKVQFV